MALLSPTDMQRAMAIARIGYANPFLPERMELEKQAVGDDFVASHPFVQFRSGRAVGDLFPNAIALQKQCERLLNKMRSRLMAREPADDHELETYENLALYQLYSRYMSTVQDVPVGQFRHRQDDDILMSYDAFSDDYRHYLELPERKLPSTLDRDVIFAGLFQVERAFFHIYRHVVGASLVAAKLRASIWQSIFTHDMRRYLHALRHYMGDIPTLITGPSGTGKELVAQSIAYSRFVEFDSRKRQFVTDYSGSMVSLNLTAMSPTLIESELFGHAKGAFTDAKTERQGFLDQSRCTPWGSVFLDEIGDLDVHIQVKLLRVLQNREYQRVGETKTRKFVGKIIAATNRNLAEEMEQGRFREDFYYRLCGDRIETPSLRDQLRDSPEDIENFVRFIATSLLHELPEEVDRLTKDVVTWIYENLGPDYAWPGNIRELEQCVRSIMIRGNYAPSGRAESGVTTSALDQFISDVREGVLSRDQLLRGYFSLVYSSKGSYRSAARQLGVDWRTVKDTVDSELLEEFGSQPE